MTIAELIKSLEAQQRYYGPDAPVVIVDQAAGAHTPAVLFCAVPNRSREQFARESDGFPRIEIWADEK